MKFQIQYNLTVLQVQLYSFLADLKVSLGSENTESGWIHFPKGQRVFLFPPEQTSQEAKLFFTLQVEIKNWVYRCKGKETLKVMEAEERGQLEVTWSNVLLSLNNPNFGCCSACALERLPYTFHSPWEYSYFRNGDKLALPRSQVVPLFGNHLAWVFSLSAPSILQ